MRVGVVSEVHEPCEESDWYGRGDCKLDIE